MAPPTGHDERNAPTWQQEVHRLKVTERKLLERVAEVQRHVSESDPTNVAARLASMGEILGYVEESARELVGLVEAFLHLHEDTIRQTRAQTMQQVLDEIEGLRQRLAGLPSSKGGLSRRPEDRRSPPRSGD
jgi:hypothetical protein